MSTTPVQFGAELFKFQSFNGWVNHASLAWKEIGVRSEDTICLDTKGRICRIGRDMAIARDEGAFPVTVYLKRGDLEQYRHLTDKD